MDTDTNDDSVQVQSRKRRRPAVVCSECRRRKVACDRKTPCTQCMHYNSICNYAATDYFPGTRVQRARTEFNNNSATSSSTIIFENLPSDMGHDPEHHAAAVSFPTLKAGIGQTSDGISNSAPTMTPARARLNGRFEKSRLFGQSHWVNVFYQLEDSCNLSRLSLFGKDSQLLFHLDKCKRVARALKANRSLPRSFTGDLKEYVPPEDICNELVQLYFRTFESVFRVLHIPTFQQEYNLYWKDPQGANDSFVVKLLLVMAIGTCFYQDKDSPEGSMHSSSLDWIHAAHRWITLPFGKRHVDLEGVQIQCLFLLAFQTNADGGDLTWITAGMLVRTAMTIGLHRDPIHFPNMSILHAELRRRLWATTLEIVVQSSLDSGMPTFISCEDFDCDLPSNIDDYEINEETIIRPLSKPLSVFTQTSTQCALSKSLTLRLKIVKALNELLFDLSYENALQMGTELTKMCRSNSLLFQTFLSESSMNHKKPAAFQIKLLDLLTRRFLLSLHIPFAQRANKNIKYYFSLRVCLKSSLLLLSYSPSSMFPSMKTQDDYMCLRVYCRGFFKSVLLQASATVCFDLNKAIKEDSSPSTSSLSRSESYQTIQDMVDISRRRVVAGETNVKAHVFFTCALAQIDAILCGAPVEQSIMNAAKQCLEYCYVVLQAQKNASLPVDKTSPGDKESNGGDDEAGLKNFSIENPCLNADIADYWLFSPDWDNGDLWS